MRIHDEVVGRTFTVVHLKKGSKQKQPNAPFTTSTLQQEASRYLGFSAKKTMSIAQQLYEVWRSRAWSAAQVTYIRTDSVRWPRKPSRKPALITLGRFGSDYLP
jgi:DNA topoisomerase-1